MIEVQHNAISLPCKVRLKVKNVANAWRQVQRLMDVKRLRGMTLRYEKDATHSCIILSARNREPVRIAERMLRDKGLVLR